MKRSIFSGLVSATAFCAPALLRYAWADDLVTVGTVNASSDVPFFIGDKKAFFREQGLTIKWTPFDSAAKMVVPLGANQERTHAVASAARGRGIFVAAIVVDTGAPDAGRRVLAAFREAADMVMIVREPDDVRAVIAALR